MKKIILAGCISTALAIVLQLSQFSTSSQGAAARISVLNRENQAVTRLTDGDTIRLRLELPSPAGEETRVEFFLGEGQSPLAECAIPAGKTTCETEAFSALGWHWEAGGRAQASRIVVARTGGKEIAVAAPVEVAPRPVVMVHGFSSSWEAWEKYLGPTGYLAGEGIPGFAVGDGRAPGTMNTGRIDQPAGRTNTIAQNAAILGEYIQGVLKITGAEKVDLVAHSMGGLIARYYIDRVMKDEAAQLIMLGSPMAGTECANLPAALNFYLPAALEIQPQYVTQIFNPQITHRKGLVFHALAGVPIQEAIQSPCTPTPTDIAVSLESVEAIPVELSEMPVLHTDLNTSEQVFRQYVLPLLQAPAGDFPANQADAAAGGTAPKPLPFSRIVTGHLQPGEQQQVVINIEAGIRLASFALYDSSRSLDTIVTGASGKVIALDPKANGLVKVEDPATMLYLGYGFNNPKPGAWKITLQATERTPAAGADYALTAVFHGGAELQAQTSLLLPEQGEAVQINARLVSGEQALKIEQAQATARLPDGSVEQIPLAVDGDQLSGRWAPRLAGLSGIQIQVKAAGEDGATIERAAFLVVEAQPQAGLSRRSLLLAGGLGGTICAGIPALLALGLMRRRRRRKSGQTDDLPAE